MKTCTLCKDVADIVNHDGLCGECVDYIQVIEQEEYLNYIIEEGEE